jgi:hypothetical protein
MVFRRPSVVRWVDGAGVELTVVPSTGHPCEPTPTFANHSSGGDFFLCNRLQNPPSRARVFPQ